MRSNVAQQHRASARAADGHAPERRRGARPRSVILLWMSVTATAARDTDASAAPAAGASVDAPRALALARDVLATEAKAIAGLADRLGAPFVAAVELILASHGRVVVSGIGKSGHIARKLAATLVPDEEIVLEEEAR